MASTTRSLAAVGTSGMAMVNHYKHPFALSLGVAIAGTATAKVQFTLDEPTTATDQLGSNLVWYDHPTMVGLTASATGNIAFPVRAVRLVTTAWTSGPVTMTALQAGI